MVSGAAALCTQSVPVGARDGSGHPRGRKRYPMKDSALWEPSALSMRMGTATAAPLLLAVLGTVDPTTAFGRFGGRARRFDDDDEPLNVRPCGCVRGRGRKVVRPCAALDERDIAGGGYDYDVDYALCGRHKHDYSYDAAHLESSSGTYEYEYDYWVLPHDLKVELEATGQGATIGSRREGSVWKHGVDGRLAAAE